MSDSSSPGFLSRWSQRKIQARESRNPDDSEVARRAVTPDEVRQAGVEPQSSAGKQAADVPVAAGSDSLSAAQPDVTLAATPQKRDVAFPSLEDVKLLTPDSDFSAFVAQGVAPAVKNAAMKKLFADPHFNVMDGLDIYIDDYTQREVMPESMVRKMASSKFLEMCVDEGDKKARASGAAVDAAIPNDDAAGPVASEEGDSGRTKAQTPDELGADMLSSPVPAQAEAPGPGFSPASVPHAAQDEDTQDVSSLGVFPGLPTTFEQVQNQPKATRTSVIESEKQPGDASSDFKPFERSN